MRWHSIGTDKQNITETNSSIFGNFCFSADLAPHIIVEQKDYSVNAAETTIDLYEENGIKSQSYHIQKSVPGRLKYLNVKDKL